jgi:hypothetical protein
LPIAGLTQIEGKVLFSSIRKPQGLVPGASGGV